MPELNGFQIPHGRYLGATIVSPAGRPCRFCGNPEWEYTWHARYKRPRVTCAGCGRFVCYYGHPSRRKKGEEAGIEGAGV